MKVEVQFLRVPLIGRSRTETKTVEIDPPYISLMEAIEKAGYSVKGMQISVNGEPVDNLGLNAVDGAILRLVPAKKQPKIITRHHHHVDEGSPRVSMTERASGS